MDVEEKEREIRIGECRIYFGEDNIISNQIVGNVDEKIAMAIKEAYLKFFSTFEGKSDSLIDLNQAGKQSPEARKIGLEMFEHEKVGKVALFGLHPVARVIASFVMGLSKKKNMRFFKTKEEALGWLMKGDKIHANGAIQTPINESELLIPRGDK